MHTTTEVVFLDGPQIDKLRRVLNPTIPIYPSPTSSTFPTLHIVPRDFVGKIFLKLKEHAIDVSSVRLNGGAASYVLIKDSNFAYRDIDILFTVNTPLTTERETTLYSSNNEPYLCDVWTMIKYIICSCLIEHMPDVQGCTPTFLASILDTYTKKNIQVNSEQDSWALLSLQNLLGRNLELKFIEQWKRQWQFSVDSFQIDLRELLFEPSTRSRAATQPLPPGNAKTSTNNVRKQNRQENEEAEQAKATTPFEFGFFPPTSLSKGKFFSTNEISKAAQTTTQSRSRSVKASISSDDLDGLSAATIQLQLSTNEDIDDGIVVDTDDSTIDDDEANYRTPPMELASASAALTLLIPAYCAYKDANEALSHLNNKLIATYEPEKLRGGGLLKYCDLLAQDYKAAHGEQMVTMQRYMCSRFFIDFKTLPEQISVITKYISTHFLPNSRIHELSEQCSVNETYYKVQQEHAAAMTFTSRAIESDEFALKNARLCLLFLECLRAVIHQSGVCLSGDDKSIFLCQVTSLIECYHLEYDHLLNTDPEHWRKYHSFPPYFQSQHRMHTQSRNHRQNYTRTPHYRHPRAYYGTQAPVAVSHPRRTHQ